MSKNVSFNINLAPKDPFFATPLGKLLKWALSVGRYIVIFTEVIVIVSFVSRFTLDRQITDLNNSITQKVNVIDSFGDLETNVKNTQRVIEDYKQTGQSTEILKTFPEINKVTPVGVYLKQLSVRPNQIAITGSSFDQENLNNFINNLSLSTYFSDVNISKIESNKQNDSNFTFTVSAQVVKQD
jgi:Tfp pilus assembly protein PilN